MREAKGSPGAFVTTWLAGSSAAPVRLREAPRLGKVARMIRPRRPGRRDLTGRQFGTLTVLSRDTSHGFGRGTRRRWWCKYACDNSVSVIASALTRGTTTRCQRCAHKAAGQTRRERNPNKKTKPKRLIVTAEWLQRRSSGDYWIKITRCKYRGAGFIWWRFGTDGEPYEPVSPVIDTIA